MRRYPISGANQMLVQLATQSVDNASTGAWPLVHGTATSTLSSRGKVFWLRSLWAHPNANASGFVIGLADASVMATECAEATSIQKFRMFVASFAPVTASNFGAAGIGVAKVDFPAPGLKFTINCVAYTISGSGATMGMIGGCGYEE